MRTYTHICLPCVFLMFLEVQHSWEESPLAHLVPLEPTMSLNMFSLKEWTYELKQEQMLLVVR